MHKQHPQTAYRKYAVLIGTIFENCDKKAKTLVMQNCVTSVFLLLFLSKAPSPRGLSSECETIGAACDRPSTKNTTAPTRRGIGEVRQVRAAVLYQDSEIA